MWFVKEAVYTSYLILFLFLQINIRAGENFN